MALRLSHWRMRSVGVLNVLDHRQMLKALVSAVFPALAPSSVSALGETKTQIGGKVSKCPIAIFTVQKINTMDTSTEGASTADLAIRLSCQG
jgi:hypothetical protein